MSIVFGPNASVLSSDFNITSPIGTYQDTGLFVTIPDTWASGGEFSTHIFSDVYGVFGPNPGVGASWITIKLVADDGVTLLDLTDSERLLIFIDASMASASSNFSHFQAHKAFSFPITRTAGSPTTKIRLYAVIEGCASGFFIARIASGTSGRTVMSWI